MPSREDVIQTPEKVFHDPAEVLKASGLSHKDKLKALHNWEQDEKALLVADDENMTESHIRHDTQLVIEKIQNAERKLENLQGES